MLLLREYLVVNLYNLVCVFSILKFQLYSLCSGKFWIIRT
mgnify:CR=1 FL=1